MKRKVLEIAALITLTAACGRAPAPPRASETPPPASATPPTSSPAALPRVLSHAARHVPKDCELVIHVDVATAVQNREVRRVVAGARPRAVAHGYTKARRILEQSQISLSRDVHSAAVCVNAGASAGQNPLSLLVLGGSLRPGALDEAVLRANVSELVAVQIAGRSAFRHQALALAQAEDGALLLGEVSLVEAALRSQSAPESGPSRLFAKGPIVVSARQGAAAAFTEPLGTKLPGAAELELVAAFDVEPLDARFKFASEAEATAFERKVRAQPRPKGADLASLFRNAQVRRESTVVLMKTAVPDPLRRLLVRRLGEMLALG